LVSDVLALEGYLAGRWRFAGYFRLAGSDQRSGQAYQVKPQAGASQSLKDNLGKCNQKDHGMSLATLNQD